MGRFLFVTIMVWVWPSCSFSQNVPQLLKFRAYAQQNRPAGYDSSLKNIILFHRNNINYLYPLYQLFNSENRFRVSMSDNNYFTQLSEYISFTEDYQSALQYSIKAYEEVTPAAEKQIHKTVDGLKNIQHADAKRYISFFAKSNRVIMINEAHNKPLHRAFVISLLADLYRKGFRYLAMEMLNNYSNHTLTQLTSLTGHYSAEPVAGELIRVAWQTGFTLVSYEDTLAYRHTPGQRDSIQAENIYRVIRRDSTAKILVLAGYGHIAEHSPDNAYRPMGMVFKSISGIDPLTIDQTDMTEESNFGYGRSLYQEYTQKYALTMASIAVLDNEPVNITNNTGYDLAIIHPPTTYRDGRPVWLALDGLRKPLFIKPSVKNTFMIQAFYQDELSGKNPGECIPADQTYIPTNNQNFLLYLRKGKYIIVFRDTEYRILGRQTIEVS